MHLRNIRRLTCNISACSVCYAFDVFRAYQNSAKFFILFPPSCFFMNSSLQRTLYSSYIDRFYQYLFRRKSFLPIKYSLRIAYVSCRALTSRGKFVKIVRQSSSCRSFLARKNYNKRFPSRGNLFAYASKFQFR